MILKFKKNKELCLTKQRRGVFLLIKYIHELKTLTHLTHDIYTLHAINMATLIAEKKLETLMQNADL